MDVARTAVSIMGLEDKETTDSSLDANTRKAIRILSKTPTALAAFYRLRKGKNIIKPKKNLKKPIVYTFESYCAALINASINTAKNDAEIVNRTALILLFINFKA